MIAAWRKEVMFIISVAMINKEKVSASVLVNGTCPELHARDFE